MTEKRDTVPEDDDSALRSTSPNGRHDHPANQLRATIVEYADRTNRCTICPRDLTREELMVTWITADASAFVDLKDAR